MNDDFDTSAELVLAAEDCSPERFEALHRFTTHSDRRILTALKAHGPVLLRGGRGSGKSAFMISASRQMDPQTPAAAAIGLYMSLRHAPLLKSTGEKYGRILCGIIIRTVRESLGDRASDFDPEEEVGSVQIALTLLAQSLGKRIVLFFDDAAHLGREASLEEFFDIYRTLSGNAVSCKAAIYPGVTSFGVRFDVYNDATVIDLLRSEEMPGFAVTFEEVMATRFPKAFGTDKFRSGFERSTVAAFLAQATLGNMRGFVIACSMLESLSEGNQVSMPDLTNTLVRLASNHYWPLLEEIEPKLGRYQPMVKTARELAQMLFEDCAKRDRNPKDVVIHRDLDEALAKPLQILEYAGFISKREASRGMKQGGRGARYALNLCSLLEETKGSRLTKDLFDRWTAPTREEAVQFNKFSKLSGIELPKPLDEGTDLAILKGPIETLKKSNAYPYGLTTLKIEVLQEAGLVTVGDLADADDATLDALSGINQAWIRRIRNVLGQAIWM